MLDETVKALAPWPILQLLFGGFVLAVGVWVMVKGAQRGSRERETTDEQREQWRTYERIKNLEENSFKQVQLLEKIFDRLNANSDAMRALASSIYNMWGGPGAGPRDRP